MSGRVRTTSTSYNANRKPSEALRSIGRYSQESLSSKYSVATNLAIDRHRPNATSSIPPPVPAMPSGSEPWPFQNNSATLTTTTPIDGSHLQDSDHRDRALAMLERRASSQKHSPPPFMTEDDAEHVRERREEIYERIKRHYVSRCEELGYDPEWDAANPASLTGSSHQGSAESQTYHHTSRAGKQPATPLNPSADAAVLIPNPRHVQYASNQNPQAVSRPGVFRGLSTKLKGALKRQNVSTSSSVKVSAPLGKTSVYDRRNYPDDDHPTDFAIPIAAAQALRQNAAFTGLNPDGTHATTSAIPIAQAQALRRNGAFKALGPAKAAMHMGGSATTTRPLQTAPPRRVKILHNRETMFGDFINVSDSGSDEGNEAGRTAVGGASALPASPLPSSDHADLASPTAPSGRPSTALTASMVENILGVRTRTLQNDNPATTSAGAWPLRTTSGRKPAPNVDKPLPPIPTIESEIASLEHDPDPTRSNLSALTYARTVFDPIDDAVANLHLSPAKARALNEEIHRLQDTIWGRPSPDAEGDDDEANPRTTIDTFARDGHASFVLTYRPDADTAESWYTQIENRPVVGGNEGEGGVEGRGKDEASRLWERLSAERDGLDVLGWTAGSKAERM